VLRYLKHVERVLRTLLRSREMDTLRRQGIPRGDLARRIITVRLIIAPALKAYGRDVSTPDMAVSLSSATLLAASARRAA